MDEGTKISRIKQEWTASRYLAAASHDLRQPLHTLTLLHGVMARKLTDPEALRQLIQRSEETLTAMSGMLDTLLGIHQLEAGVLHPEVTEFRLARLLEPLRSEFGYHTQSRGLAWRTVPCSLAVRSDARLLEQIVRNLLSNAVKYTRKGRVLLGCRRRGDRVRIEVWDTGPGIPPEQQRAIFEEFYQSDNPAHDVRRGTGLGLAIVEHLADLLSHRLDMKSWEGRGTMFAVEVPCTCAADETRPVAASEPQPPRRNPAALMIVEDDPAARDALALFLQSQGYRAILAGDAEEAIALAASLEHRPDAIIVDYDLPGRMTGLELAARLRDMQTSLPALVLTGDISLAAAAEIAAQGCLKSSKPIAAEPLSRLLQRLLSAAGSNDQT